MAVRTSAPLVRTWSGFAKSLGLANGSRESVLHLVWEG